MESFSLDTGDKTIHKSRSWEDCGVGFTVAEQKLQPWRHVFITAYQLCQHVTDTWCILGRASSIWNHNSSGEILAIAARAAVFGE